MESTTQYDLIVIGAGSAGLYMSISMQKFGFKVLLVEKSPNNVGGDCLNFGCVPSKSIIHVAEAVHKAKEASAYGLNITGKVDIQRAMAYVRERQDIIRRHENPEYLIEEGIDVKLGEAVFSGKNEIEVNGKRFLGKRIIIATGSSPIVPPIDGLEKTKFYTNEKIFEIEELPGKLLVLGGGPIGTELGQTFARLGSKVTIVEKDERILSKEVPELSQILMERLREEGIKILVNSEINRFKSSNIAEVRNGNKNEEISFDTVLVSVGRSLNHEGLGLQNAGIETRDRDILIDDYLRTTNKRVFVSGDAAGQYKFSHVADLHGSILLNNFFSPLKKKVRYDNLSWVTFTDPQVATFGLSEAELKKQGKSYERIESSFSDEDRAVIEDYQYGKIILYTSKSRFFMHNSKIYGGTIIAPFAGEMIQEFILAKEAGVGTNKIFDKIYPYPTRSRINKEPVRNRVLGQISPFIKKLLHFLY